MTAQTSSPVNPHFMRRLFAMRSDRLRLKAVSTRSIVRRCAARISEGSFKQITSCVE